jgi:hypothetical protein
MDLALGNRPVRIARWLRALVLGAPSGDSIGPLGLVDGGDSSSRHRAGRIRLRPWGRPGRSDGRRGIQNARPNDDEGTRGPARVGAGRFVRRAPVREPIVSCGIRRRAGTLRRGRGTPGLGRGSRAGDQSELNDARSTRRAAGRDRGRAGTAPPAPPITGTPRRARGSPVGEPPPSAKLRHSRRSSRPRATRRCSTTSSWSASPPPARRTRWGRRAGRAEHGPSRLVTTTPPSRSSPCR